MNSSSYNDINNNSINTKKIYQEWWKKMKLNPNDISKNKILRLESQTLELLIEIILNHVFENHSCSKFNIVGDEHRIIVKSQNIRHWQMEKWNKSVEEGLALFLYKKTQSQNVNKIYTKDDKLEISWEMTIIIDDKKSYLPTRKLKRKKKKIPTKDQQIPAGEGYYVPDSD